MAFNECVVTVVGRLGGDGEFRELEGDKCVVNARVCANVKLGKKEVTNWFSFSLWDGFARAVGTKLFKGDLVFVRGPLTMEEYEGKNGKQTKLVIYPDSVILLGPGMGKGDAGPERDEAPRTREYGGGPVPSPFGGRR